MGKEFRKLNVVNFQAVTAILMQIQVLCDVMLCQLVNRLQRLERKYPFFFKIKKSILLDYTTIYK